MKKKQFWLALLFFLLVLALFFNPSFFKGWLPFPGDLLVGDYAPWNSYSFKGYAPGGMPHKAQGIDVVRQVFPWKNFSIKMLKEGQFPLWNPYNFAGNPHLANFQSAVFYPLNLLFFLLPFNLAWLIYILIQPFFVCLFTYWFLREIKVARLGAIFAGLVFAYGLYLTAWLEWGNLGHTLLWLPLCLFLIEKVVQENRLKWWLLLNLSLVFSVLAGYVQIFIYLVGVITVYFFFRIFSLKDKRLRVSKVIMFLLSGGIVFLLSAVQLLPTWEIFWQSARGAYSAVKIKELLMPWFYLITTFIPDFFGNPASRNYWYPGTYIERVTYIGVWPLFFALLAVFFRPKESKIRFFAGLALITLAFSLNWPLARLFFGFKLPLLSTGVPTRILFLFSFALAVLAGLGVETWFKTKKTKAVFTFTLFFGGIYCFFWTLTILIPKFFPSFWWGSHLAVSQRNLIIPSGIFLIGALGILASRRFSKKIVFGGILLLTLFDLYFYFQKITPFSSPESIYPKTEVLTSLKEIAGNDRFWGYGSAHIESNIATLTKFYATDGYDPLFIRRYGELISASYDGRIADPIPRSDVNLAKGYGKEALRDNFYRQRLLNLLGVKFILHKVNELNETWQPDEETFAPEVYQLVWQETPWQIYENKTVLPRAFLVGEYQVETEPQKIVDLILNPQFSLRNKVILEQLLPDQPNLGDQSASQTEIIDYQPNTVKIKTVSSASGILFLSDNFYPGWQAVVDGQSTKIYRANYAFRAVVVPKGEHLVVFHFSSTSFNKGVSIFLGSGIFIIIGLVFSKFKRKFK